jgi:hypothetical protein
MQDSPHGTAGAAGRGTSIGVGLFEQDVDLAKSSTELTGVESVHLVTSVPPMLLVNLSADMSQDQVDEVVAHFA